MPRCRVCGCTETHACNPPCSWSPGQGNLCSSCATAVDEIIQWVNGAVRANYTALIREVKLQFAEEALLETPLLETPLLETPPPKRRRRK